MPKKKRCLISIIFDEGFWQPLWYDYYSRFFADEDIYVLGNPDKDVYMRDVPFNVVDFKPEYFLDVWACQEAVQRLQHEKLQEYEVVVFAEADEFFVPDPNIYRDFGEYMDRFSAPYLRPWGFDVVHDWENGEPPLDVSKPFLAQRRLYMHQPSMTRTVITKFPIDYTIGFHASRPQGQVDRNLVNFHLHRIDYDLALRRHEERHRWKPHPRAVEQKLGSYILYKDRENFDPWMKTDWHMIEEIPERYKEALKFSIVPDLDYDNRVGLSPQAWESTL